MSGKSKRRKRSSAEKLRIVLAGMDGSIEISELCRQEGINPPDPIDDWKNWYFLQVLQGF